MTPRPQSPPPIDPRGIPALSPFIGERRWVTWRWELNEKGKWTKPPRQPNGAFAMNNDRDTWHPFEACWAVVQASKAEGIGFMLLGMPGEEFAAIDIDKVRDAGTGALLPWASELVERANSYCEVTPSETGLRILGIAPGMPPIHRKIAHPDAKQSSFELYRCCARFITVSGHVNGHDTFTDIGPVMRQLEALGAKPNGHAGDDDDAEPIDLEKVSPIVTEMIVHGTKAGRKIKHSGQALMPIARALHAAGHSFGAVLATLRAHPDGIAAKFKGRIEKELRRCWSKLQAPGERVDVGAPYDIAKLLRDALFRADETPTLYSVKGSWYGWTGRAYREVGEDAVRARVYSFLKTCINVADLTPVRPNTTLVNQVVDALRAVAYRELDAPAWLDGEGAAPPEEIIACANGLLHLRTGKLLPHNPRLFNLNAIDVEFRAADASARWIEFLNQLWPEDEESITTLQEICGYCLTPDTRQEKAFLVVGPKRSGKGTIARVLRRLVGAENSAGPTLAGLGRQFGLQSLIDKRLAIISDARLGRQTDPAVIAERLLSITGEDAIDVDRKNKTAWTGQLQVRFLILTNELPRLADASGALASRFVMLVISESFFGREDLALTDKLLAELTGILNWAIEGWRRLRRRGHFLQPESARDSLQAMEDLGSPISAFVRGECEVKAGRSTLVDVLFDAWTAWCADEGYKPGTKAGFGKQLRAALPGGRLSQPRDAVGERLRVYAGIGLKHEKVEPAIEAHVKWYAAARGYGFVTLESGRDALLPSRAVGGAEISDGQRLMVRITEDEKGPRVREIVEFGEAPVPFWEQG